MRYLIADIASLFIGRQDQGMCQQLEDQRVVEKETEREVSGNRTFGIDQGRIQALCGQ